MFPRKLFDCVSILLLATRIRQTKDAAGISVRCIETTILAFVADIFSSDTLFDSVISLTSAACGLYLIYQLMNVEPWKGSYHREADTFKHWYFLVLPSITLALLTHDLQEMVNFKKGIETADGSRVSQTFILFSMFLKSVSVIPQLLFLSKNGEVGNFSEVYILNTSVHRVIFTVYTLYQLTIYSKLGSTVVLEISLGALETFIVYLYVKAIRKYMVLKLI